MTCKATRSRWKLMYRQHLSRVQERRIISGLALGALLLSVQGADAANKVYSTIPTTFDANGFATFSGTNFTVGTIPTAPATTNVASGDALFFGTSTVKTLTNDLIGASFAGMTFRASSANTITISGNDFILTGDLTNNISQGSSASVTINNNFSVGASRTVTTAAGSITVLNGIISGPGTLSAAGGSELVIGNAANTFTGDFGVDTGYVLTASIGNTAASGATSGGLGVGARITFGGDASIGTLVYTGAGETTNKVFVLASTSAKGGTISNSGTGTLTLTGGVTSAGTAYPKALFLESSTADIVVNSVIQSDIPGTPTNIVIYMTGAKVTTLASPTGNLTTGAYTLGVGTLMVTNTSGSATGTGTVELDPNAAISGTGTVAGPVTITSAGVPGGVLAPGVNPSNNLAARLLFGGVGSLGIGTGGTVGTTTTAGGASLLHATLDYDLSATGDTGTPIAANDSITTAGSLTLGTDAFNFNALTGNLNTTKPYTLITGATSVGSGSFTPTTTFINTGSTSYSAAYTPTATGLTVQFSAAPELGETATMSLIGLGLAGLFLRARKRRRTEKQEMAA